MARIFVCLPLLALCYRSYGQSSVGALTPDEKVAHHPTKDTVRVQLLNQLAFANYYSNPLKSLQRAFEARNLADSLGFSQGEAEAYRQIGLAYWAQADMSTAISYFLTGLRLAEQNLHRQVEADLTANLGTAYNGLGDHSEALRLLKKSRAMQQALKNEWREASVLNNMGDAYLALRQYDSSIYAYSFALRKSEEQKYALGISTNLRNIGNVWEQQGRYDSALSNYSQCLSLSLSNNDNRGIVLSRKSIASVYLKTKKLKEAEQHARLALGAAEKSGVKAFIRDLYELLAKISEAQGNESNAFSHFKKYVAYKDSVQNLKVLSEANAARFRFEIDKRLTEIRLLKKESEIQTAAVALKNNQLMLASLVVILSMAFLAFTIRNYQKEKNKNRLLEEKNRQIETQRREIAEQREKIMEINNNLESLIEQRTHLLEQQNYRLAEYAHFNAHKLRAPVASILGLVTLLERGNSDHKEIVQLVGHLKKSSENLDDMVKSINATLEKGLDVYKSNAS